MRLAFLLLISLTAGAAEHRRLSLAQVESLARERSPRLKASLRDAAAARDQADAQWGALFPRLSLDGIFRYVSVIPEMRFGPGPATPFGDYKTYSVGPTLSYTLWDGGGAHSVYRGLEKRAEAREEESEATGNQVLLQARSAYVQAQLAQQELDLVERSLELAKTQSRDIKLRYRAGSASRLDLLNSEREVSSFELRFAQGKAEWKAALAELGYWIGDESLASAELDTLESSAARAKGSSFRQPGDSHPQLKAQRLQAESAEASVSAQAAQQWPVIQLIGRASLDYPNGPTLEQIRQGSVSVGLSWSLFEWGRISNSTSQKRAEAESARLRLEQGERELDRDWTKAKARLDSWIEQRSSAGRYVQQSEEVAKLGYESYRAGRAGYLDVQSANLKLLESRVQKARVDAQLLLQYHALRFLSETGK